MACTQPARPTQRASFKSDPNYTFAPIINGCWQLAGGHGREVFDNIQIFTKYVPNIFQQRPTPAAVEAAVRRSMNRLQVTQLDLVQLHWWEYSIPGMVDTALALADLQSRGLIRFVGSTNMDVAALAAIVDAGVGVAVNQVQFSLLDRRPLNGMLQYCQARGIKLFTYGSVGGGLLSDKYVEEPRTGGLFGLGGNKYTPLDLNTSSLKMYWNVAKQFGGQDLWRELLLVLRRVADKHGVSVANVALRWVMQQEWLNRLMLAMYRCWERFSVTHWSSMLPALVLLEAEAPREWLQRLEDVLAPRLADCSALQLLTLLVALTKLKRMGMEATQAAAPAEPGAATSTSATVDMTVAAAAPSSKGVAPGSSGRVVQSGGGAAEAEAVAARGVAATTSNPSTRPIGNSAAANVRGAGTAAVAAAAAAGSSSRQLQQRSGGSGGDADDSSSRPSTAAAAAAPATIPPGLLSGPAASLDSAATSTSSSGSNSSMLLSLDRLHNLRTARWRQRRLAGLVEAELLPTGGWLAAWWAASGSLLRRMRYAPSELLLTASWLVSLKMRPPSEWLERASIKVSQSYSKVMAPGEQMQLAAALLPLAGRGASIVATSHTRRTQPQPPPSVQASPPPPAPAAAAAAEGTAAEGQAQLNLVAFSVLKHPLAPLRTSSHISTTKPHASAATCRDHRSPHRPYFVLLSAVKPPPRLRGDFRPMGDSR
ncbi:hypothetical protein VOLCADRAFT_88336 [Volvox carteri f. nagariensis]|uniref:NADP-dependent oxidoreductase domain-containing protein n=1 Tax=Volvox carteri f. nagariensis TaxID=3068 RepID=D8TNX6_VOLCA|nr:uncharacterized protein VOLCADRAFT_88336 [Volvox carteri f. nagariensis]EFJ51068.1 hypothetical protein VOLCADRAFT_88336 [Volvox carteri f. nagariensis]|eukprot:XP_002948080.1 hypothetical protein VOLCADRAFT_88336 [Volvox carteri f. nagariensis]